MEWRGAGRGSGALVAYVRVWVPIFWVFGVENRTSLGAKPSYGDIWKLLKDRKWIIEWWMTKIKWRVMGDGFFF